MTEGCLSPEAAIAGSRLAIPVRLPIYASLLPHLDAHLVRLWKVAFRDGGRYLAKSYRTEPLKDRRTEELQEVCVGRDEIRWAGLRGELSLFKLAVVSFPCSFPSSFRFPSQQHVPDVPLPLLRVLLPWSFVQILFSFTTLSVKCTANLSLFTQPISGYRSPGLRSWV